MLLAISHKLDIDSVALLCGTRFGLCLLYALRISVFSLRKLCLACSLPRLGFCHLRFFIFSARLWIPHPIWFALARSFSCSICCRAPRLSFFSEPGQDTSWTLSACLRTRTPGTMLFCSRIRSLWISHTSSNKTRQRTRAAYSPDS